MRKERLLKFNQARQINSLPAAHTTFCEREERHIWHWSFLSLPGWLGPSAFVQGPDVDETVLLPEKQNKNKDKDLSKWSLTINNNNNNKDGSFFHLTRDVMCPCGTSSGSSSLQTIQGSFMLETMGFLLLKHDMAVNKSYLHLCQHVSNNFAIFIFCNVWELCRRGGGKEFFHFNQQHIWPNHNSTLSTLCCYSPEAKTTRGRSSISSDSFQEGTAGYNAACSWGPPAERWNPKSQTDVPSNTVRPYFERHLKGRLPQLA